MFLGWIAWVAEAAPPGVPLTLSVGAVVEGQRITLDVGDADPGETVRMFASPGPVGFGPCPPALGGVCLDLGGSVQLVGSVAADASGRARLRVNLPAAVVAGDVVTFQAAAARPSGASVTSPPAERTVSAAPWSHVITVDGDLGDWSAADERFETTSGAPSAAWVTWDDATVYVAFEHPDVLTGGSQHWTFAYFGTDAPGATTGVQHNTQVPGLPFAASHLVRRKADGSYDSLEVWDDGQQAWVSTPFWLGTGGSLVAEQGEVLELAVPRAAIGAGGRRLYVALGWVYEGSGFESTYAGVPADAFVDGYDPDLGTALVFDLHLPDPPTAQ